MRPGIEFGQRTGFGSNVFLGVMAVLFYVGASIFLPMLMPFMSMAFSLGIPDVMGFSIWQKVIAVLVLAVVIEEITRGSLRVFLEERLHLSPFKCRVISMIFFMGIHVYAYTAGFYRSVTSPFVAAGLFAGYSDELQVRTNSYVPSMILHLGVNTFLMFNQEIMDFLGAWI